jgi:hypothetical protein
MTELDNLFKLDGDLDSLDKNLHEKLASALDFPPKTQPKLVLTTRRQETGRLDTNPGARGP